MNRRLTDVVAVVILIVAPSCATRATNRTPAVRASPTPTPSPAAGAEPQGPAEAAGEAAKQAIESPGEAAKKAGEAAVQTTKEAALSFRTDMHHWPERLWV